MYERGIPGPFGPFVKDAPLAEQQPRSYFVVSPAGVEQLTRDELDKRLSERYYGDAQFLDHVPNPWPEHGVLIIVGGIALPWPTVGR